MITLREGRQAATRQGPGTRHHDTVRSSAWWP